jgi:hypothetical protein
MKPLISYVPDDLIELCQNSLPAKDSGDVEDTFVYVVGLHTIYDKRQLSLRITQDNHPEK